MINLQTIAPTLNFCVTLSNFLKTPANPAAWGKKITGNEKETVPRLRLHGTVYCGIRFGMRRNHVSYRGRLRPRPLCDSRIPKIYT